MAATVQTPGVDRLSADDFETASVRSAAPSYFSDAPSYHSIEPSPPPYTMAATAPPSSSPPAPAAAATTPAAPTSGLRPRRQQQAWSHSPPHTGPVRTSNPPQRQGLPPVPTGPIWSAEPSLNDFRIPVWSSFSANPAARHYRNVANRRAARKLYSYFTAAVPNASSSRLGCLASGGGGGSNIALATGTAATTATTTTINLEDPDLVGEEGARAARRERLLREGLSGSGSSRSAGGGGGGDGDEILVREDRCWDWLLGSQPVTRYDRRTHGDGGGGGGRATGIFEFTPPSLMPVRRAWR